MIQVRLMNPRPVRELESNDLRYLCIHAETTVRHWLLRGSMISVQVDGASIAEKAHILGYLEDVAREVQTAGQRMRVRGFSL